MSLRARLGARGFLVLSLAALAAIMVSAVAAQAQAQPAVLEAAKKEALLHWMYIDVEERTCRSLGTSTRRTLCSTGSVGRLTASTAAYRL